MQGDLDIIAKTVYHPILGLHSCRMFEKHYIVRRVVPPTGVLQSNLDMAVALSITQSAIDTSPLNAAFNYCINRDVEIQLYRSGHVLHPACGSIQRIPTGVEVKCEGPGEFRSANIAFSASRLAWNITIDKGFLRFS